MKNLTLREHGVGRIMLLALPLLLAALIACTPEQVKSLEGILQNVDAVNGQITVLTKDGKTVTLTISTQAPVQTEGATSALETLAVGTSLTVETDREGRVAQAITARQTKIEGAIVLIAGDKITVETERGVTRTLQVTAATRIELEEDFPGSLADLKVGMEVEVKFDSESLVAFRIDSEEEEAEIEGVIVAVQGNEVTIETDKGRRLSVVVNDRTKIELAEDLPGTLADLRTGTEVEVKFDPSTRVAFKIEVGEEEEEAGKAEIEGVIVGIQGSGITIETERGRRLSLLVSDRTRIGLEKDLPGTLADLRIGTEVEAKFDPATRLASKIEVEEDK